MRAPRVIFVTGKGGVGKTTVSAALGVHLAATKQKTLLVETDSTGRLGAIFDVENLGGEPTELERRLWAARLQPRALLEEYFRSFLRIPLLSRGLLSSRSFNALTAAAPGISEFLLLQKLLQWLEPGWRVRRGFDVVIVDGPASGHALKLLGTPRTIASLVPGGPIGGVARRALALLADHQRSSVVVVALPEELAVTEALETYEVLANDLALHVTRPVLNRTFPRRFAAQDIDDLASDGADDPVLHAARFLVGRRRETERHLARLRRALSLTPVALPMLFGEELSASELPRLGSALAAVLQ